MNKGQTSSMIILTENELYVLSLSKKQNFNDEWSVEFDSVFEETKQRTISEVEDFLLTPTISLKPFGKIFNPNDDDSRQHIKDFVNESFQKFKKENN